MILKVFGYEIVEDDPKRVVKECKVVQAENEQCHMEPSYCQQEIKQKYSRFPKKM